MIRQHPRSPAIVALETTLSQTIPFLTGTYPETNGRRLPRLQYGAGPARQTSHLAGIALDIFLDKAIPRFRILAHHIIAAFVTHSNEMKWSQIIYEHSKYVRHGNFVRYEVYTADTRHNTHIHIDWWKANSIENDIVTIPERARNGSFGELIRNDLAQINQLWTGSLLPPLDLRIDPLRMSVMRNVGR